MAQLSFGSQVRDPNRRVRGKKRSELEKEQVRNHKFWVGEL